MNVDEAIKAITRQYPNLSEFQIEDYTTGFSQFSPSNIEKLIEAFRDQYDFQNAPKWAWFAKQAAKMGLYKKQRSKPSWSKCSDCHTEYSLLGKGCPKCGSKKASVVTGESIPSHVYSMQEDCLYCKVYHENLNNQKSTAFGPDCNDYAKREKNFQYCGSCKCNQCCIHMKKYNENPRLYTENNRKTEYPWLFQNKEMGKGMKDLAKSKTVTKIEPEEF